MKQKDLNDIMHPSMHLLSKLGSIAVHAEELLSPKGHEVDRVALQTLFDDAEVKDWMAAMKKLALLPVKR